MLLNIDLGELSDEAEELYRLAHVANIALGAHAGDAGTIARARERCRAGGTIVGAHPSYPDREGFGRRKLEMPAHELAESVAEQCARLPDALYLKPHGALYHAADADPALATAVLDGAAVLGRPTVIGPAGGALEAASRERGWPFAREGFADRGFRELAPGRYALLPRGQPGALLGVDAARAQARALLDAGHIDTICVHGDTPDAVAIATAVRELLDARSPR
jgi:UPF0271 protein